MPQKRGTDSKNAEQLNAKQQAQKEQAEILDLTHDAIIVLDLEGTILYWNRGAHEIYGYSKKEAIGRNSETLLKTKFPISKQEIQKHLIHNSRWEGELVQVTKENSEVIVASRWVMKFDSDGRPFSVLEFNSDMTVQRHAKEVLKIAKQQAEDVLSAARKQAQLVLLAAQQTRSDQRLLLVVEAAPSGIVMVDQNGIITLVNSQFEILFGYKREELLGRQIELLAPDVIPITNESTESTDNLLDKIDEDILQSISKEGIDDGVARVPRSFFIDPKAEKMSKGDFFGQRKDGALITVEIGLNPLIIENERFVLAYVVDISERNFYAGLLKEKISELARSNDELEQFAYVCSHDLQEPLRVISNYTFLLSKRYKGQLDAKADLFIDFTIDASKRMQTLINDLLVFSRLKRNAVVFGKVDCNAVAKMALENLKISIAESGAIVNCETLPEVNGDSSQLIQLIQNLVSNAIKFRSLSRPVISITSKSQVDHWLFAVTDYGIGLDMQFADRIFKIFQRLHVKEDYPGSGIGLAVCKSIAQRHGGNIWVESYPENGTTFYFTIPKN